MIIINNTHMKLCAFVGYLLILNVSLSAQNISKHSLQDSALKFIQNNVNQFSKITVIDEFSNRKFNTVYYGFVKSGMLNQSMLKYKILQKVDFNKKQQSANNIKFVFSKILDSVGQGLILKIAEPVRYEHFDFVEVVALLPDYDFSASLILVFDKGKFQNCLKLEGLR